jgi:hypothetical protein
MKPYFKAEGSVRGDCGHKHRTATAACGCMLKDQRDCVSVGGFSDRKVVKYVNGYKVALSESDKEEIEVVEYESQRNF